MIDLEKLNKAIILTEKRAYSEAEKLYLSLLENNPNEPILLSSLGLFYVAMRNFSEAEYYLKKSYELKKTLGIISALGVCKYEQKDYESAVLFLEEAIEIGENEDVYNKLILSLFQIKSYEKAFYYTGQMFEKFPENPNSVSNMVKALTQSGKLIDAEKICVDYLKEHQDSAALWFHLGYLKELIYCNDKQAFECYRIASELGNNEAFYNMAVSMQKQGDYKKAEEYYKKMLEFFPEDADTITSLGMCYLSQKRFKEGYDLFFKREKGKTDAMTENPYQYGQDFEKELLVICDQGFGDHIQFVRYLPFLKEKVQSLKVATHKSLKELFERNYENIDFIDYEEINPKMQSVRVTDLAYLLDMDFDNIPFSEGYLNSESKEIKSDKIKVGLCWEAGNAGIRTMINRTINVKLFEPLFNMENVQVFSFQVRDTLKGNERYPQMVNLAKDFKNFDDTAQALKSMDVVVTVDTSVAHLAGALGVKTYLLLPYVTDWRWFDDVRKTPWYDSIQIFKQTDPISWLEPITKIVELLKS